MDSADLNRIQHQCLLQSCRFTDLFLYTGVYLLPETGNAAHQCRTDFFNGSLNICRTEIDTYLHSLVNTEIAPCFLEHMCQREEVHRNILVGHCRQAFVMRMELLQIARMVQHHTFRFPRRTGSIKDVSQIIVRSTCGTFFYHLIMRQPFAHCHKLIKIDGRDITRVLYYRTVENNQLLQRRAKAEDAECRIILILFANKKISDLRIVDNVLCLCGRTRCIERNSNPAIGKCTEIDIEPFRLIL